MKTISDVFTPVSTYRVQFNQEFTFKDLENNLDYLHDLGITTIYASPVFEATPGSTHGYDITDPHKINPAIGTLEQWRSLQQKLQALGMSWIQDVVPNHMALHPGNRRLMDVLERGPLSPYYHYFDIDWEYPDPAIRGKLMLPFLDKPLQDCLAAKEIKLAPSPEGWVLGKDGMQFPLSVRSYDILMSALHPDEGDIKQLLCGMKKGVMKYYALDEWRERKAALFNEANEQRLLQLAHRVNRDKGLLTALLENQYYTFYYWREAETRINYRRFFTVNGLICLRMEDDKVFEEYHTFLYQLYSEGLIQGLRIDHIDGLYGPGTYIKRLRALFGDSCYIIAEKILAGNETLPREWELQGSTGYEFLGDVNQLLTDQLGLEMIARFYRAQFPDLARYERLAVSKKLLILSTQMAGEWDNLVHYAYQLGLVPPALHKEHFKEALGLFMAHLPVYRIYLEHKPLTTRDLSLLEYAVNGAYRTEPGLTKVFEMIRSWWLQGKHNTAVLRFLQRVMQFTGPLTAKGVEDTVFYVYNALVSHNEVGDAPEGSRCSLALFHERAVNRYRFRPLSLNTTATHDTKRGEDARIRLNALTLHPHQWIHQVQHWHAMNRAHCRCIGELTAPDMNDEYFIYQSIIAGFPADGVITRSFIERLSDYFIKVVREAKVHSNWSEPNEAYEKACLHFIESLFAEGSPFPPSLQLFFEKVGRRAAVYSLTQTLLKITAPGVPDIYQGCELWDLSFVDPDNRRPVDYGLRRHQLSILQEYEEKGMPELLSFLQQHRLEGLEKLYVTWKALHARRDWPDLFTKGQYVPIYSDHTHAIIAYARSYEDQWCLVVAPLLAASRHDKEGSHHRIALPAGAPAEWRNIFTGEEITIRDGKLSLNILKKFPVALLVNV
jgi:(1->4)-alpha-D-glucan 1-alpha-D-glucosylmutase